MENDYALKRTQMARLIFIADNAGAPDPNKEWTEAEAYHRQYAYNIADGLIAAGYKKESN